MAFAGASRRTVLHQALVWSYQRTTVELHLAVYGLVPLLAATTAAMKDIADCQEGFVL